MDDPQPNKKPLKLYWFEIYYVPVGASYGQLETTPLASETHESAKLKALQRIPMRHFYRTRQREEIK
jgi:hypothetical protein